MAPDRLHPAPVEDHDRVGVQHRRQPVRDDDRRGPLHDLLDRLAHQALRLAVERARRLVEDEDGRAADHRPRDGDPLALAAGQADAALAHHRVVAVRDLHDEVVRVGHAGGPHDLGLGHVVATVGDVVADRRVEQQRLLGDDAEEPAIGVLPQRPEVAPVDGDHAGGGIVQAQHEVDQRRLADAARPHHRHHLALADVKVTRQSTGSPSP